MTHTEENAAQVRREAELPLQDHIRKLEEQLLQADVRRSRRMLEKLLADEFIEFATDGAAYDKAQVIDALQREGPYRRSLSAFHISVLADDVLLVTYRATRQSATSNETVHSLRSSTGLNATVSGGCRFTKAPASL